jgi:alpha-glucosidase
MLRAFLAVSVIFAATALSADDVSVSSPRGAIEFKLSPTDGGLNFQIEFKKQPVIERSPLAMSVDERLLTRGANIGEVKRSSIDETYPWRGIHSRAINRCNTASVSLTHRPSGTSYFLEVRVFDDGAGFRFIVPGGEKPRIPQETTTFVVPAGSTVWYHDLEGHYEDTHQTKSVAELSAGQWVAPPMTFKLSGDGGYASITEAALVNYSGMALQADGKRGFQVVLGHKHPPSYPFRLRYADDVERLKRPAALSGAITTPCRVVMISPDLNGLVTSDIVHNLCPPPDQRLFPQDMATSWIKPGRAVWKYLDGGANTFEEMKEFSRMAGELGFEYHVIEGFWSRWNDEQLKELVDYSRERGVALILWRHSRQLRTAEAREEFFKKLHDLGVAGAKINFFDHEHKEVIDLYAELLAAAALHQLLVNFHGANKPTGEARTWPNELIREGVRGMESSRLQARALHDTTLPFTRYLAGHGDYTPMHFAARRGDTTWAHQIATVAVFDEPLLTYGAHPKNLLNNPALPMIKSIPPVWDETLVLPQSVIGELAAFARRSGDMWFLAVLNGPQATATKISLDFLGDAEYQSLTVRDQATNSAAVNIESGTTNRRTELSIGMPAGGGFIARFSKN